MIMDINIKTLQVTAMEAAVKVDVNTTPPIQKEISALQIQPVTVIEMIGDVDSSTAPLVQKQVLPLVQPGSQILLDMTKVLYMSSAGLRLLLSLYRLVLNQKGQLLLVGVAEEIKDTMSITGFLDFFKISDTLDSGLKALNFKLDVFST
jgi:anti-sigma B factor antagonist